MRTTGARLYKITIAAANKRGLPNLLVLTPNHAAARITGLRLADLKARKVLRRKCWQHLLRPGITRIDYIGTIDA